MEVLSEQFVVIGPEHAERAAVEAFIRQVFEKTYGAQVEYFARVLLGIRDEHGRWVAALGYTPAAGNELLVERYGNGSVQGQISRRLETPVMRAQIVEVGNLAACTAGAARQLIISATRFLYEAGFSWVVFTATRLLLNSFARMKLRPIILAEARGERLPDQGRSWGRYYEMQPQIVTGSLLLGYLCMKKSSAMASAA